MKTIDRTFGWLLILATCGHTIGTLKFYPFLSDLWVWSLSASLAGAILGAINIIRAGRSADGALAAVTAGGCIGWALMALAFGSSIHNLRDPRVVGNVFIATVLVICSCATLRRSFSRERFPAAKPAASI
jgi:fucose 4-O-acetylase-like acetyltransferase